MGTVTPSIMPEDGVKKQNCNVLYFCKYLSQHGKRNNGSTIKFTVFALVVFRSDVNFTDVLSSCFPFSISSNLQNIIHRLLTRRTAVRVGQ